MRPRLVILVGAVALLTACGSSSGTPAAVRTRRASAQPAAAVGFGSTPPTDLSPAPRAPTFRNHGPTEVRVGRLPAGWSILGRATAVEVAGRSATSVGVGRPGVAGTISGDSANLLIYDASEPIDSLEALAREVEPGIDPEVVPAGKGALVDLRGAVFLPALAGSKVPSRTERAWVVQFPDGRFAQLMGNGIDERRAGELVSGMV